MKEMIADPQMLVAASTLTSRTRLRGYRTDNGGGSYFANTNLVLHLRSGKSWV